MASTRIHAMTRVVTRQRHHSLRPAALQTASRARSARSAPAVVLGLGWTDWTAVGLVTAEALFALLFVVWGLRATRALEHDGEAHVPSSRRHRLWILGAALAVGVVLSASLVGPLLDLRQTSLRGLAYTQAAAVASLLALVAVTVLAVHRRERLVRADLDEHAAAEARLRASKEESDALVYGVSHDLKAPLVSMDYLLEDLKDQLPYDDEHTARLVARLQRNVDRMESFVGELLAYARVGTRDGPLETVRLVEVVEDVFDHVVADPGGKPCRLRLDTEGDWCLQAPPAEVRHILQNLVENAVKYGRDDGVRVRVSLRWKDDDEPGLELRVEDDGPGVPRSARSRVFGMFTRLTDPLGRVIPGTGMGLALVAKSVQAIDGRVSVSDSVLGGAAFVVRVPAAQVRQVSSEPYHAYAEAQRARRRPLAEGLGVSLHGPSDGTDSVASPKA